MNKAHYLFVLLFISNLISAQIKFEPGYYLDNNNQKVEGFIKNTDWRNNPTSFEFKTNEASETQTISIDFATEFGINLKTKYVRTDVDIEKSSNKINNIGYTKEPQYVNERVFLKELVSGTSKLFIYENNGLEKFFYSVNNSPVKQLIYIKYYASAEDIKNNPEVDINTVLTNDYFRRQLWYDVKCSNDDQKKIKDLDYKTGSLTKYFKEFNNCSGDTTTDIKEERKTSYNFKASAIYNIGSLKVTNFSPSYSPEFSDSSFAFGFEAELILPFNNNKWGVIFEPSYNQFKGDKTQLPAYGISKPLVASAELNYIQLPFGIRHYFFLSEKSKIFANAIAN
ncbi:MAG TPA: hypothetical protein VLB74_08105, partial [Flavobacterium sp.]|uniref:PorT family protein n=1 Tax=Flavobacterium sp. TaxID=239 RepID=UPI002C79C69D